MEHLSPEVLTAIQNAAEKVDLQIPKTADYKDLHLSVWSDDHEITVVLDESTTKFLLSAKPLVNKLLADIAHYKQNLKTDKPENEEIAALRADIESLKVCFKGVVQNYNKANERLELLEALVATAGNSPATNPLQEVRGEDVSTCL